MSDEKEFYANAFDREEFPDKVLDAADALFRSAPWKGTDKERDAKMRRFLKKSARAYEVPTPSLLVVPTDRYYRGVYHRGMIMLPSHSVVSLFYEFRRHLQYQCVENVPAYSRIGRESRDDALGWSRSLFYQERPEAFVKAVAERRIANP